MSVRRFAAWGVHFYTALGLPLSALAMEALTRQDANAFFGYLWVACFVDSTDGTMARRVKVREVVPEFDGRKLDDIVDFLTFAFLPALAVPALGLVPKEWAWVAVLPLMASGYGFCQEKAKTPESFVGFPSYWNIVVLYLYVLGATPIVTTAVLAFLSLLVFVPIHYVYPTKAKLWKPVTIGFGALWAAAMAPVCFFPDAAWAPTVTWISLLYPAYYLVISIVHHQRVHDHEAADVA